MIVRDAVAKGHSVVALFCTKARASDLAGAGLIECDARNEIPLCAPWMAAMQNHLHSDAAWVSASIVVVDWATRRVLSWRLSNTMEMEVCMAALEEASARFRRPEVFSRLDQDGI